MAGEESRVVDYSHRPWLAQARGGPRLKLQDDEPHGDVVTHRRGCGEGVKKLVIAEGARPRVRPANGEEDNADVVEDTARDEQPDDDRTSAVEQGAGEPERHIAEQEVQRYANPSRGGRPPHLQCHAGRS